MVVLTVVIDDSDKELYQLAKDISSSDFCNVELETQVLCNLLREKGRKIDFRIARDTGTIYISFPKKRILGIF